MATKGVPRINWSDEELAILEQIYRSGETVKAQAHLLPRRTLTAIKSAMSKKHEEQKKRGWTSWVWPAIERELTAVPSQTIAELSARIGCCYRQVFDYLTERHGASPKSVWISGWQRKSSNYVQRWSLGDCEDVPKPGRQTADERRRLDRLRYRTKVSKIKSFETMLAQLGVASIPVPTAPTGRVYRQSMSLRDFEEEAA